MTRRRRTEIIGRGEARFATALADQIRAAHEVRVIQEPQQSLVMAKFRESGRNGQFYLGELLVTEAKVSIGTHLGLGIIQDDDAVAAARRSLDAAVIDAAYAAGVAETASWEPLFLTEEARILAQRDADLRRIERSKVSFETMDNPDGE